MPTLIIMVDPECCRCSSKMQKVLCVNVLLDELDLATLIRGEFAIEKIVYEKDKVMVSWPFNADKLSCKAGRIIKNIKVAKTPPPKPEPKPEPKPKPKSEPCKLIPYPYPYCGRAAAPHRTASATPSHRSRRYQHRAEARATENGAGVPVPDVIVVPLLQLPADVHAAADAVPYGRLRRERPYGACAIM
ncbi:hypothetical protein EJB05_38218, partial [Eragrostis curvula]